MFGTKLDIVNARVANTEANIDLLKATHIKYFIGWAPINNSPYGSMLEIDSNALSISVKGNFIDRNTIKSIIPIEVARKVKSAVQTTLAQAYPEIDDL